MLQPEEAGNAKVAEKLSARALASARLKLLASIVQFFCTTVHACEVHPEVRRQQRDLCEVLSAIPGS